MKIYLRRTENNIFVLQVYEKISIQKLKKIIHKREKIPMEQLIILFKKIELENKNILSDYYEIKENSILDFFYGLKEKINFIKNNLKTKNKNIQEKNLIEKIKEKSEKEKIHKKDVKGEIYNLELLLPISKNYNFPKSNIIQKKEKQKEKKLEELSKILKETLKNKNLLNDQIIYLSKMIIEDPPQNLEDIINVTSDFFDKKLNKNLIFSLQKILYSLIKKLLIIESNNWCAKKLGEDFKKRFFELNGKNQKISYLEIIKNETILELENKNENLEIIKKENLKLKKDLEKKNFQRGEYKNLNLKMENESKELNESYFLDLKKGFRMEDYKLISNHEKNLGYDKDPFEIKKCEFIRKRKMEMDPKKLKKRILKKLKKENKKKEKIKQIYLSKLKNKLPNLRKKNNKGNYSSNIKIHNFDLEIGYKILLENSQLILEKGIKYGLIGKNGIGKSILMYSIARKEIEGINKKPQILMIEQEIEGSQKSPLEIILDCDQERLKLLKLEKKLLKDIKFQERKDMDYQYDIINAKDFFLDDFGDIFSENSLEIDLIENDIKQKKNFVDKEKKEFLKIIEQNNNKSVRNETEEYKLIENESKEDKSIENDSEEEEIISKNSEEENKSRKNTKEVDTYKKLEETYIRLEEIDAYHAEGKVKKLLVGLGFTNKMINSPSNELSGGWRMRISLAKILFCEPDILLLDEPTNHLDLNAVLWLETYLKSFKNCVLVISHCKNFLNNVCDKIIMFENKKLYNFNGSYDEFERVNNIKKIQNRIKKDDELKQIAKINKFINKNRYNSNKSGLVKSRKKFLNRMEKVRILIEEDPNYKFHFGTPSKINTSIIRIDAGYFSYPNSEKPLLVDINLKITTNSRMAILGTNGSGKTTLLKILTNSLTLKRGNYYKNYQCKISLFTQHNNETLNPLLSPYEHISLLNAKSRQKLNSQQIFKKLSNFGIQNDLALKPIYLLSEGQKSRVSFSIAAFQNPNLIVLDEPTNHLDLDSIDALILAVNRYEGGVVVVSHDEYFVSNVCRDVFYLWEGRLKRYKKDFECYKFDLFNDNL